VGKEIEDVQAEAHAMICPPGNPQQPPMPWIEERYSRRNASWQQYPHQNLTVFIPCIIFYGGFKIRVDTDEMSDIF